MFFKKRIKPTKEMLIQQKLCEENKDNPILVKQCFEEIIKNTENKGLSLFYDLQLFDDECICYIYPDKKAQNAARKGDFAEWESFSYPLALIEYLDAKLNG